MRTGQSTSYYFIEINQQKQYPSFFEYPGSPSPLISIPCKTVNNLCKSNYFVLKQKFINDKMRAILIDWLIDVHNKFKMIPQTFFLTVNLIDRFLEVYECERDKLQLVGISCLFLSSKYEEIYPPDLVEFVKVCDNTYTSDEMIQMESCILSSLNFDLIFTSSYQFHEMFCQKLNIKDQPFHLSLFLLFLSTMEFSMARFRPSQIALSAIYLSNKFLKLDKWRVELPHVIGCTEQEIKNCALDLFLLVHKVKRSNLSAVTRRFASRKHMCVSKIQIKLQEAAKRVLSLLFFSFIGPWKRQLVMFQDIITGWGQEMRWKKSQVILWKFREVYKQDFQRKKLITKNKIIIFWVTLVSKTHQILINTITLKNISRRSKGFFFKQNYPTGIAQIILSQLKIASCAYNCPQEVMLTCLLVFPVLVPSFSTASTMSIPCTTSPKTTCFPSSHEHGTVVMKN